MTSEFLTFFFNVHDKRVSHSNSVKYWGELCTIHLLLSVPLYVPLAA
jgi:hypothetical protein